MWKSLSIRAAKDKEKASKASPTVKEHSSSWSLGGTQWAPQTVLSHLPSETDGFAHTLVQREDEHDDRKGIDEALTSEFVPELGKDVVVGAQHEV